MIKTALNKETWSPSLLKKWHTELHSTRLYRSFRPSEQEQCVLMERCDFLDASDFHYIEKLHFDTLKSLRLPGWDMECVYTTPGNLSHPKSRCDPVDSQGLCHHPEGQMPCRKGALRRTSLTQNVFSNSSLSFCPSFAGKKYPPPTKKPTLVISFDLNWAFKKLFLLMNHIKPSVKGSLTLFK